MCGLGPHANWVGHPADGLGRLVGWVSPLTFIVFVERSKVLRRPVPLGSFSGDG